MPRLISVMTRLTNYSGPHTMSPNLLCWIISGAIPGNMHTNAMLTLSLGQILSLFSALSQSWRCGALNRGGH